MKVREVQLLHPIVIGNRSLVNIVAKRDGVDIELRALPNGGHTMQFKNKATGEIWYGDLATMRWWPEEGHEL